MEKELITKQRAKQMLKASGGMLSDESLTSFVSLQNVNKIYPNGIQAVYDFNLEINKHDFVALVGPSGCGKSTTLRMIAGLEDISSGALYINKTYSNSLQSKDRNIAMVFQSYALYPQLSVYDNIAFGLKIRKLPKDDIRERVFRAADILDLGDYLDRKPAELSGGQMQRVALGRAIVRQVDLFLMDEPLSNLDAKLRVQMRSEIVRIHKEMGATTIYVTHDQTEAMTMANVIVVMNKGFIQQVGRAIDVYDKPDNLFVATFIGSPAMNIFETEYAGGELHLDNGMSVAPSEGFAQKYERFVAERIAELKSNIDDFDNISDETLARMKAAQIYKKEDKKAAEQPPKPNIFKRIYAWLLKRTKKKRAEAASEKRRETLDGLNAMLEHYKEIANGGRIKAGIRPEHVYIASEFTGSRGSPEITATVTLAEMLGSENIIHFDLFGIDFQAKTKQIGITVGTEIQIIFDIDKLHVFDTESGFAIK